MGALEGRVAIITGAAGGIGREHALLFAREGAKVVVNDLGGSSTGEGSDASAAQLVVDEILAGGGTAIASGDDIADEEGAQRLIDRTVDEFGALHVLVNNAGILRDRMIVNMSADEWDSVIRVHLRGHFLPLRAAGRYFRLESKNGSKTDRSIINTSSTSGLLSNVGQANYGAAKTGIATLTEIAQKELGQYAVRCNAIAPVARTRLTLGVPGSDERYAKERASSPDFDRSHPGNISPLVAYLATDTCPLRGKVIFVRSNKVQLMQPWTLIDRVDTEGRWTIDGLRDSISHWSEIEFDYSIPTD
ncbi:MAG: SDR family oxidoreductase [bacterium]|nr:SDR family oxidoreductase [bacterium]